MQRRAAAIYFVFFLVVGVGAYAYIGVAEQTHQPTFETLEGTGIDANGTATIDGTQYQLSGISHTEGGGHGGGGALVADLAWTNESAVQTASLEHEGAATYQNESYTVLIPNESDPSGFTLQAQQNVSAILSADPAVENSTATRDGTEYVVYRENDTIRPLAEYRPEPDTIEFSEGETFPYEGTETTIAAVSPDAVQLEWIDTSENTRELGEGQNVTLASGQQYFTHFEGEERALLVPASQYQTYDQITAARHTFQERLNGLWAISIISILGAITVLSTAYLPVRG